MSERSFAEWMFSLIGTIEPDGNGTDGYLELLPQSRFQGAATAELHAYGAGPFCRFRVARRRREAGLYVLTEDEVPVYAGECANLEARWGPNGYGGISPRNCFRGGQPTNCRVNAAILASAKVGRKLELWFAPLDVDTALRRSSETQLIRSLKPGWNRAKMSDLAKSSGPTFRNAFAPGENPP